MSADLGVVGLGRMAYAEALDVQRRAAEARLAGAVDRDLLLLVEHPPVITLGRGFHDAHLPTPRATLASKGIDVFEADRGGDVTFHGPGQLVGYPIFDLTEHRQDLHWFLRSLEHALIAALDHLGIAAEPRDGLTGVWTADRKIASIGIHVRKWVTWHGFALNVLTDLDYFDLIVPCGIPDVVMTSVQRELAERAPRDLWGRANEAVMLGFAQIFDQAPRAMTVADFETATAPPG